MLMSASQEAQVVGSLGKKLEADGRATRLLVHDHNWNLSDRAISVLGDAATLGYAAGSAFHCYGGDPSAQSTVHDRHPTKDVYFTECTGQFSSGTFSSNLLWNVDNLVIGATRNWARSVLLWNLALDPTGGPHRGGCSDCRGVVTIDPTTGSVTRNEEYYALAHLGRAVRPAAVRIASTFTVGSAHTVAFRNPDGSRVLIIANDGEATTIKVRDASHMFIAGLPGRSVSTFSWSPTSP
jgi:glucosylceramidase